jgi:cytochrome d ubiquinol oxidase subunit II
MYFMTDGFVLGIGILYPFVGKNDREKRLILNSIGPVWDGNEVWLITAGAITFGAFPVVYAVMFTSLYTPLMLILFSLILRGVSFEFRSKVASESWRAVWDKVVFLSSLLATILLGVAFANIFKGVMLGEDNVYQGTFMSLIHPYGLTGGALFVLLFVLHGLSWLCIKTDKELMARCERLSSKIWYVLTACIVIFLVLTWMYTDLYANYLDNPVLLIFPAGCVCGLILHNISMKRKRVFLAWASSALIIAGAAGFGLGGMFPRLFPSSIQDSYSLTIYNSSSDPGSLKIMLIVIAIFIPLVLIYQGYAYRLFSNKMSEDDINKGEAY